MKPKDRINELWQKYFNQNKSNIFENVKEDAWNYAFREVINESILELERRIEQLEKTLVSHDEVIKDLVANGLWNKEKVIPKKETAEEPKKECEHSWDLPTISLFELNDITLQRICVKCGYIQTTIIETLGNDLKWK